MAHRIQLIAIAAFAGGCGLGVVGVEPTSNDAGAPDAGPVDAARPVVDAGPPPVDCSVATCDAVTRQAAGFVPVAFGSDACPAGFDAQTVYEDPKPQTGSCGCGECTYAGASCASSSLPTKSGGTATTCTTRGDTLVLASGVCHGFPLGATWENDFALAQAPDPSSPGICSAKGTGLRAQVDVTTAQVCTRRADTCAGAMCKLPGALKACMTSTNAFLPCPKDLPDKHVVGTDFTLACTDCQCKPVTTCTGTLSWWRDSGSCKDAATGTLAAGACTEVDGQDVGSVRWDATVAPQSCETKPDTKATATLTGAMTICCPK